MSLEGSRVANDEGVLMGQFLALPGASRQTEAIRLSAQRREQGEEEKHVTHTFSSSDV